MTTLCDEFESLQLSLCRLLVNNAEKINKRPEMGQLSLGTEFTLIMCCSWAVQYRVWQQNNVTLMT